MKNKKLSQGQSLIEVVAALSVVILVITALAIVVTLSIANAKFSQNQTLAGKYSQEVMEKIRSYRDKKSWDVFTRDCNDSKTNPEFGFSSQPPIVSAFSIVCRENIEDPASPICSSATLNTCGVIVTAGWIDAKGRTHKSELKTNFTSWKE